MRLASIRKQQASKSTSCPKVFVNGNATEVAATRPNLALIKAAIIDEVRIHLNDRKATLSWRQNAGCGCGCSPGFIINTDIRGVEFFITLFNE